MVKMLTFLAYLFAQGHAPVSTPQTMHLSSAAFRPGEAIPRLYTCHGKNLSIPLHWSGVPKQSKSLALVVSDEDPKAGTWYHWSLYNISPQQLRMNAGAHDLPIGVMAAKNSWLDSRYRGPCPASGKQQYDVRLYALDSLIHLKPGASADELHRALHDHTLSVARISGTYAAS